MFLVHPISAGAGAYYLRQGSGVWVGEGVRDLGLRGEVDGAALRAVLDGREPSSGRLLPETRPARRRCGWDLVFSAPKSLSLMAAADRVEAAEISAAHRNAVDGALSHFERCHLRIRRASADGGLVPSRGAVAARFDHVKNAGGEPHLHSHLILANLALDRDGKWWSVGPWWLGRRELYAIYQLALRHDLEARGIGVDWRVRADGLVDVAAVPRAAVRAASTRGHEAAAGARFTGRATDHDRPWKARARAAGWDPPASLPPASVPPGQGTRRRSARDEDIAAVLTARLAVNGSSFGRRDVLVALAGIPGARFTPHGALRWSDEFLSRCTPVPDGRVPLWTSRLAESADHRLEAILRDRATEHVRSLRAPTGARSVPERLLGGDAVVILGVQQYRSGFLAHSAVVRECATEWAAAGMRAVVASPGRLEAQRWTALTGIEAHQPSVRPDVLIIDQADRRTSAELGILVDSAPGAKVVLVEGGTSLRCARPRSRALEGVSSSVPVLRAADEPVWDVGSGNQPEPVREALGRWATLRASDVAPTLLVGLGVPEAIALNGAARRHMLESGQLTGPELHLRDRAFRAGDTVLTIRPAGAGLPAGTLGTVESVDPTSKRATIRWPHCVSTADRALLTRIGHGYAATPRLAARTRAPLLVLGPSEGIGLDKGRVLGSFLAREASLLTRDRERSYGPDTWPVQR